MFIENKYTKIYFALMEKARCRNNLTVYEKHHVIPKSLGGSNSRDNIVRLSPREHFISHALLVKMVYHKKHKRSMSFAFIAMKRSHNKNGYVRIGNGRLFEKLRISIRDEFSGSNNPFYGDARFSGENNPFYGKKHSDDTRKRMSEIQKVLQSKHHNSFYGKKHSEQTKKILSEKNGTPITVVFIDGTKVSLSSKQALGLYLKRSKPQGVALCNKPHLWGKYNIKDIVYENS